MNFETLFLSVFFVFLLVTLLFSLIRGSKKSFFRMLTVVFSAVFAFLLTVTFKNIAINITMSEILDNLISEDAIEEILYSSPIIKQVVSKTVAGLFAPILFLALFLIFSIITYVLYFIITLLFRKYFTGKKGGSTKSSIKLIFAALYGFIQCVVVSASFVILIVSYTNIVPEISPKIECSTSVKPEQKDMIMSISENIEDANNTFFVSTYKNFGLNFASNSLTGYSINYNGKKINVNMSDEISLIADLVISFMDLKAEPIRDYGEQEAALIKKIGQSFTKSEILSITGTELLHQATEKWKYGDSFLNIKKPYLGDELDPLLTKLIDVFYESTKSTETFNEDIITTTDLIAIFAKNGILSSANSAQTNNLFDSFASDGVITEITVTLNKNPRMKVLIPEITNIGLKILANSLGISSNTAEIYNEVLTNIANYITNTKNETDTEKRVDELKPVLKTEFENIGISIEPEYIDLLAEGLINDFGDFEGEITPEFIAEFFDIYNNMTETAGSENSGDIDLPLVSSGVASTDGNNCTENEIKSKLPVNFTNAANNKKIYTYPKYAENALILSTGAAQAAKGSLALINNASSDKIESFKNSSKYIGGMRSYLTAVINRTTTEEFLFSADCVINDPQAEGLALETMVKEVASIINSLKTSDANGLNTIKKASQSFGKALDSLAKTEMYGMLKTSKLFTAIIQSKTLVDATNISIPETIKISKKQFENAGSVSFVSLMNVFVSTVDVMNSMQNNNISTDQIEDLIGNLTPENTDIIQEVITTDRMEQIGIPKDKAETSTELISDLFKNLGKIEDPDTYADEAKAVENIINLGIAAKNNNSQGGEQNKHLFSKNEEEGSLGCSADDMVNNIMSSTAVCETVLSTAMDKETVDPFGVSENISKEDADAIKDACDNYVFQNADKSPEEFEKINNTLDAINKLLGITD